jgi:hypothetical protein
MVFWAAVVSAAQTGSFVSGSVDSQDIHATVGQLTAGYSDFGTSTLFSGVAPILNEYIRLSGAEQILPTADLVSGQYSISTQQGLNFSIAASDSGSGIQGVYFRYKVGGEDTLRCDTLIKDNGIYSKSILGRYFSEKGFFFYIEVTDSAGNRIMLPDTGDNNASLTVGLEQGISYKQATGEPFPKNQWKMFSVPLTLASASAARLLEPLLGKHDKRHWKMVRWIKKQYIALNPEDPFHVLPGKAFFLYVWGREVDFNSGPARSVRIDRPYRIVLEGKTWTQIGCPFAFGVQWSNFQADNNHNLSKPLSDEYINNQYVGLDPDPVIVPWRGYWVYNYNDTPCTLNVSAIEAKAPLKRKYIFHPGEWAVSLKCKARHMVTLGSLKKRLDNLPCPPRLGQEAKLLIKHQGYRMHFLTDFRNPKAEQGNLIFQTIRLDFNQERSARITPCFFGNPPEAAVLLDDRYLCFYDLRAGDDIVLEKYGNTGMRQLTLLCGSSEFIADFKKSGLSGMPGKVEFYGNCPNPFNPQTRIGFGLPVSSRPYEVRLHIRNAQGRLIHTPFKGFEGPGRYWIRWDGKDASGGYVGSGIYFYTIQVMGKENYIQNGKMVYIR